VKVGLFILFCNFCCVTSYGFELSQSRKMTLGDFSHLVYGEGSLTVGEESKERLTKTRGFVEHLLDTDITVYGLTTGFADLRNYTISKEDTAALSDNILESHDAGIGKPIPSDVTLGAMILLANSLSNGYSAFKPESLETLIGMINAKIIPFIPSTGSLGASGDLAYLARLGRAMKGFDVPVRYKGEIVSAKEALQLENIPPFEPSSKEGLALTNGTPFMTSMLAIAYIREVRFWENMLALQGVFLNSVNAVDAAFSESIHIARNQEEQVFISKVIRKQIEGSPFIDCAGVQNDYSTRCLPQIFGPKLKIISSLYSVLKNELNATTDNPLLFMNDEITEDVSEGRIFSLDGDRWVVLSGGNFHGEYLATTADAIATANAKLALTMERQLTFINNPNRNGGILPTYLIPKGGEVGLQSGFMICQYTANSLAQKIAYLGNPSSIYNLTSANESEDVVSYGATSAQKLLDQLDYLDEFSTIYFASIMQAYAIKREELLAAGDEIPQDLPAERIFQRVQKSFGDIDGFFPIREDVAYGDIYAKLAEILKTEGLGDYIDHPIMKRLNMNPGSF